MQLRDEDVARLDAQDWATEMGERPYIEFRGTRYLRQRDDGACVFLEDNGYCRIHARHGFTKKPLACQMFPFTLMPATSGAQVGLSYACPSVINNRGDALKTHMDDVRRLAQGIPELKPTRKLQPLMLNEECEAQDDEVRAVINTVDRWMTRVDLQIDVRLEGFAWLVANLAEANLEKVRGDRFVELLDTLVQLLPDMLDTQTLPAPTARQQIQLRQVVFAHLEDPKIPQLGGWWSVRKRSWQQLRDNRKFGRGEGMLPVIGNGWPDAIPFNAIEHVTPSDDDEFVKWVDFLLVRYIRSRVHGGRAWGPGYYGWSVVGGLQAMCVLLAATGWLARAHAAGRGRNEFAQEDVEAALMRTDRAAGRAPWLGRRAERLRLRYLEIDLGISRLMDTYRLA